MIGYVNRKYRRQHELQEVAKQLEEAKKPAEPEKPLRYLEKIEKPIPRPPTPSVKIPNQVGNLLKTLRPLRRGQINLLFYGRRLLEKTGRSAKK